ncbi:RICIN domain-containing protein [Kitasatospora sp. NPDC127059]|uniref:RICIN domain-containing protein n=1 Tax=unclassified Kitasatospora TaxID=2633591 RepID=UPI0036584D90
MGLRSCPASRHVPATALDDTAPPTSHPSPAGPPPPEPPDRSSHEQIPPDRYAEGSPPRRPSPRASRQPSRAPRPTPCSPAAATPAPGTWHHLTLAVQGQTITASIDHNQVASVTDAAHHTGQPGLGVGGFEHVDFANTTVTPLAAPPTRTVVSANSAKCLDVTGASTTDGAQAIQWTCGTGANQRWTVA